MNRVTEFLKKNTDKILKGGLAVAGLAATAVIVKKSVETLDEMEAEGYFEETENESVGTE